MQKVLGKKFVLSCTQRVAMRMSGLVYEVAMQLSDQAKQLPLWHIYFKSLLRESYDTFLLSYLTQILFDSLSNDIEML